jgi:hypothetical protein
MVSASRDRGPSPGYLKEQDVLINDIMLIILCSWMILNLNKQEQ